MVIFPKAFSECKQLLVDDRVLICEGRLDFREDALSLVADKISEVNEGDMNYLQNNSSVEITIPRSTDKEVMMELSMLLKSNAGNTTVVLNLPNGNGIPKKITLPYKISYSKTLQNQIDKLLS